MGTASVKENSDYNDDRNAGKGKQDHHDHDPSYRRIDIGGFPEGNRHSPDRSVIGENRSVDPGVLFPGHYVIWPVICLPVPDNRIIYILRGGCICVLPSDRGAGNRGDCPDIVIKDGIVKTGS